MIMVDTPLLPPRRRRSINHHRDGNTSNDDTTIMTKNESVYTPAEKRRAARGLLEFVFFLVLTTVSLLSITTSIVYAALQHRGGEQQQLQQLQQQFLRQNHQVEEARRRTEETTVTTPITTMAQQEQQQQQQSSSSSFNNNNNNNNSITSFSSLSSTHNNNNSPLTTITADEDVVFCKYHGNCPVKTICGEQARCVPYLTEETIAAALSESQQQQQQQHSPCVTSCLAELAWDLKFQDESAPILTQAWTNPYQCVVQYNISQSATKSASAAPTSATVEEWMQRRFRHVVRVDPTDNNSNSQWQALCHPPCETQEDCPASTECRGRAGTSASLAPKTCQPQQEETRIEEQSQQQGDNNNNNNNDMVIVTAADSTYFDALQNLVASAKFWAPEAAVVVYNLGLTRPQVAQVQSWNKKGDNWNITLRWPDGIPTHYPAHVRKDVSTFAWKPIIINQTVHDYQTILWLDAGATLVGTVAPIRDILHRDGIFLVKGQDADMKRASHPGTYQWLGHDKTTFDGGPHYAGNVQGYVFPSRYISTIVIPNAECALQRDCIAPPKPRRRRQQLLRGGTKSRLRVAASSGSGGGHRYDQTSLSILAYPLRVPHYTEYLAATRGQLNANLTDKTATGNRMIVWTARGKCRDYTELTLL